MAAPWDAPLAYRNQYTEEDEPPPPPGAEVPHRVLEPDYDPDELTGVTSQSIGQTRLLQELSRLQRHVIPFSIVVLAMDPLDDTDRKLIAMLRENARAPTAVLVMRPKGEAELEVVAIRYEEGEAS